MYILKKVTHTFKKMNIIRQYYKTLDIIILFPFDFICYHFDAAHSFALAFLCNCESMTRVSSIRFVHLMDLFQSHYYDPTQSLFDPRDTIVKKIIKSSFLHSNPM